jgi:hypothetical protein
VAAASIQGNTAMKRSYGAALSCTAGVANIANPSLARVVHAAERRRPKT